MLQYQNDPVILREIKHKQFSKFSNSFHCIVGVVGWMANNRKEIS